MGPRQCGKSSLFYKSSGSAFREVTLDDLQMRKLASTDPALFLVQNSPPILIDEAQYAPELFSQIKIEIDRRRRENPSLPVLFRLTGSNQVHFDRRIKESLAGRASFFRLHTLAVREVKGSQPDLDLSDFIFRGGWPELHVNRELNVVSYLNDYIRSYLEKDIALSAGVEKLSAFHTVIGLLAARTGELLNYDSIGREAGITAVTVREWTGLLDRSGLAGLLRPYATNLNKRLVKTPKFYYLDTGIAARLQGHQDGALMMRSPQAGHLFETLVLGEIVRTRDHNGHDWQLYFWRTRDGEEYDFIVVSKNKVVVLDAQIAIQSATPIQASNGLKKAFKNHEMHLGAVTFGGREQLISRDCAQIPIASLGDYLISTLEQPSA
jgi:predicted AAA+ superfamily ATPase